DHSMQDSLTVHLVNNRGQKILLDIITSRLTPWTLKEYVIEKEAIPFTDSMQLIYTVSASDESFDIEAGVDDLRITPQALTNIASTNLTDVNLYPNPTTGILRLSTDDTTIDKVNIYTTTGVLISQLTVTNRKHMDISDLATGSYILQIFTGHQNLFFKIIKN
ncbi:MAG TPA: T9SS type A sorting domain-containing protein, partial [Saprospiraceae bacterium]|nr:T9SS type A sorting domain-containing protein [Saprospiraceae bacterium]